MNESFTCPKCGATNSLEVVESRDPITFELNPDVEQAFFDCWNCHRLFLLERRKFFNTKSKFVVVAYGDSN